MEQHLRIRLIEAWSERDIADFTAMAQRRDRDSPWVGRWQTDEAYYRWKFRDGCPEPAIGACAYDGEGLVGSIVLRPLRVRLGGEAVLGGEVGDLFVESAYRGRGLFRQMVAALAERARTRALDLVFCVPNRDGYGALLATGEFLEAPQAERFLSILPLRPSRFLPPRLRGVAMPLEWSWRGWLTLAGGAPLPRWQGLDALLPELSGDIQAPVAAVLDIPHRILIHPQKNEYRLATLGSAESPFALAIAREGFHKERKFLILGLLRGRDAASRRGLLRALQTDCLGQGHHAIAFWSHRHDQFALLGPRTPFIPASRKRFVLLKTPRAQAVIAAAGRIEIDMIHTDKL